MRISTDTFMKSAYELAMERLNKQSPQKKLTNEQKKQIAELDSVFSAKVAEREIALKGQATEAELRGDYEAAEKARQELASERRKLQANLEEKKERIRKNQ
jgi:hypothetical protein